MARIKFSESIIIRRDAEFLFDYTQDYSRRLVWDSFLKRAELMSGADAAAKGVKAYCVSRHGLGMETIYVSFNRPAATAIKMTRGPWMFKSFLGSWTFRKTAADVTEVIFLYSFTLRFPLNLFNRLMKAILKKNVRHRLLDLKACCEQDFKATG